MTRRSVAMFYQVHIDPIPSARSIRPIRTLARWITRPILLAALAFFCGFPLAGFADPLENWHRRDSGTNSDLLSVVYADGVFVAVGTNGTILSSPDGVVWTARSSGITVNLNGITYQQGRFFALGDEGVLLTSVNAIDWKTSFLTPTFLYDVVHANGTYVLVGWDYIATSADGETWTMTAESGPGAYTVAFGNGLFAYGGENGNIKTSVNGLSWAERLNELCAIVKIIYTRDHFFAVGCSLRSFSGSSGYVSADGVSWTLIDDLVEPDQVYLGIAEGNGTFVAVGYRREPLKGQIRTSRDGLTWSVRDQALDGVGLNSVTFGENGFVAVGDQGTILQSDPSAPPNVILKTNAASYGPNSRLEVDVTVANPGGSTAVDVYFGVVLPSAAGPGLGCPGGDAVAFITGASAQVTCLSAPPQTFQPFASNVTLPGALSPTTLSDFFSYTWGATEPPGVYTFFLALTPVGAFADGQVGPSDLLAAGAQAVTFDPEP